MLTFVLGGARSGKSRFAEARADEWLKAHSGERFYIATAQAFDAEMSERIALHQRQRGPDWQTIEAPLDLPERLEETARTGRFVLVDCITLWLSNLLLAEADINAALGRLDDALANAAGEIIMVSNEVGLGIVPDNALARRFRDIQGSANQRLAARASRVFLITAGLPLPLK